VTPTYRSRSHATGNFSNASGQDTSRLRRWNRLPARAPPNRATWWCTGPSRTWMHRASTPWLFRAPDASGPLCRVSSVVMGSFILRTPFNRSVSPRRKREDISPFSLREGKLERPKTTRCLQRSACSLQTESGCSNLHTMTHPNNGSYHGLSVASEE